MRKSYLIFAGAMLVIMIVIFCFMGNDEKEHKIIEATRPTEEPTSATQQATQQATSSATEEATEELITIYTDFEDEFASSSDGVVKNSNTNEQVTNFKYLSQAQNSLVNGNSEDAITCYIKDSLNSNSDTTHYLIDLKMGIIYFSSNPSRWYEIEDYSDEKDLSDQEISDIIDAINNANTQNWQELETGENSGCDRFSTISLEYTNGAQEKHKVACLGCVTLDGFNNIVDTVARIAKGYKCEKCGEIHIEGEETECSQEQSQDQNQDSDTQSDSDEEYVEHYHYYHNDTTIYYYE